MKISEYPEEIRAFTEFACMVCMTEKRKGDSRYKGCGCRPSNTYCPWMEEVIVIAMKVKDGEKEDIFTKWAEIPIVQETFKKQADKVDTDKPIYTNIRGLK